MLPKTIPQDPCRLGSHSSLVMAAGLVTLFGAILLPLPRPITPSIQPWRVEMLAAILIAAMSIWIYRRPEEMRTGPLLTKRPVRLILLSLLGFTAWSCASVLWAGRPGPVAHHTLSWAIYFSVVVISLILLRFSNGRSTILVAFAVFSAIIGGLCLTAYATLTDFKLLEGTLRIRYGRYAELLVTILPLLFAYALLIRRTRATLAVVAAWLLGWMTVMLSLSKGAFLAGVAGHVIVFAGCLFLSTSKVRKQSAILLGIWLALTVLIQTLSSFTAAIPSTTDYISGAADPTRSTSTMRLFTWRVSAKMAADNWLIGIGGDNFGTEFNRTRAAEARLPVAGEPEKEDDYAVERAHNEPLQIMAELGLVGTVLLSMALGTFIVLLVKAAKRRKYHLSPLVWGAISGIVSFGISSMVSSFSFRALQNGVAFFSVFAIGLAAVAKKADLKPAGRPWFRSLLATMIAFAVLTLIYCGAKLGSEYYLLSGDHAGDRDAATALYEQALRLDPDNANVRLALGSLYAQRNDNQRAAASMRSAIDRGLGTTPTYGLLAEQQRLAGDSAAARETFIEGLKIFPASIYLRVAYGLFLEDDGERDEANQQRRIARSIDGRHAKGWYSLIRDGSTAAFYKAQADPETAPPAELSPHNAVLHYLDKTP